ncbi:MAG: PEP-CTERM sorting domain-containing protein [Gammaproteobacteria bacterium]
MKNLRRYISAAIVVNVLSIGSVQALVVDFEIFDAIAGLESVFVGANSDLNDANTTHRLIGQSFGNEGGITFSGGVLLQDPLNSMALPIMGDGGSIYYGTAFSPSTSITTENYTDTLSIDITTDEFVTRVSGGFVHGLNTRADGQDVLVDYEVNYFNAGLTNPIFTQSLAGNIFTDGADLVSFGLDTETLAGGLLGALINRVEISAVGYDFTSTDSNDLEFDFLLSSVSFNADASPVPVPAALPLFMSALLGGFVAARRKKSNDNNISG